MPFIDYHWAGKSFPLLSSLPSKCASSFSLRSVLSEPQPLQPGCSMHESSWWDNAGATPGQARPQQALEPKFCPRFLLFFNLLLLTYTKLQIVFNNPIYPLLGFNIYQYMVNHVSSVYPARAAYTHIILKQIPDIISLHVCIIYLKTVYLFL